MRCTSQSSNASSGWRCRLPLRGIQVEIYWFFTHRESLSCQETFRSEGFQPLASPFLFKFKDMPAYAYPREPASSTSRNCLSIRWRRLRLVHFLRRPPILAETLFSSNSNRSWEFFILKSGWRWACFARKWYIASQYHLKFGESSFHSQSWSSKRIRILSRFWSWLCARIFVAKRFRQRKHHCRECYTFWNITHQHIRRIRCQPQTYGYWALLSRQKKACGRELLFLKVHQSCFVELEFLMGFQVQL